MTLNAEGQPLSVDVLNGEVVMTGPRVAIAMEPGAAAETARRLVEAAGIAAEQGGATAAMRVDRPDADPGTAAGDAVSNDL